MNQSDLRHTLGDCPRSNPLANSQRAVLLVLAAALSACAVIQPAPSESSPYPSQPYPAPQTQPAPAPIPAERVSVPELISALSARVPEAELLRQVQLRGAYPVSIAELDQLRAVGASPDLLNALLAAQVTAGVPQWRYAAPYYFYFNNGAWIPWTWGFSFGYSYRFPFRYPHYYRARPPYSHPHPAPHPPGRISPPSAPPHAPPHSSPSAPPHSPPKPRLDRLPRPPV
jgi:hypothetical protein